AGMSRTRCVFLERLAERCEREALRAGRLAQHAKARERSHQAIEGRRVHPGRSGDFVSGLRSIREAIGEAQFGAQMNDPGDPMAHRHLYELTVRWNGCGPPARSL